MGAPLESFGRLAVQEKGLEEDLDVQEGGVGVDGSPEALVVSPAAACYLVSPGTDCHWKAAQGRGCLNGCVHRQCSEADLESTCLSASPSAYLSANEGLLRYHSHCHYPHQPGNYPSTCVL